MTADQALDAIVERCEHVTVLHVDSDSTVVLLQLAGDVPAEHFAYLRAVLDRCLPPNLRSVLLANGVGITVVTATEATP